MEMKYVEEFMVDLGSYPHIKDDCTLEEAIKVMRQFEDPLNHKNKGIPRMLLVFDQANILVGILRRRDIFRGLEPKFLLHKELDYRKKLFDVQVDPNLSEMSPEQMMSGIKEQAKRPVTDVMHPVKIWVNHNDHVLKAIYEMVDHNISLLPVLKGDRVLGVLRSVEVFQELARILLGDLAETEQATQ